jgi:hypothetical protein
LLGGSLYGSKGYARIVELILLITLPILIQITKNSKPGKSVRQFPKERKNISTFGEG